MRREIILDTESTGLDWMKGDRLIEIGCVEIVNLIPTGEIFHVHIDPQRDIHPDATRVHGFTREMLRGKPLFADVADDFLNFVADGTLVIHNASFDVPFLNHELNRAGRRTIGMERVIDTLQIARRKHPGSANSLDALCARYGVDVSRRTKHGALLDAEILAEVYAELAGGRQAGFDLTRAPTAPIYDARPGQNVGVALMARRPAPLAARLTEDALATHQRFIAAMGEKAVWATYIRSEAA